jgi:hypothetical protein
VRPLIVAPSWPRRRKASRFSSPMIPEIILARKLQVETPLGLNHFAGTNFRRRARDGAADVGVVEVGRKVERVREKDVAKENAKRVAPACVDGRLGTAPFRIVHDVVVHESGEVNQFDDDGEIEMARA